MSERSKVKEGEEEVEMKIVSREEKRWRRRREGGREGEKWGHTACINLRKVKLQYITTVHTDTP